MTLLPHKLAEVCVEKLSGRSKLAKQLAFCPHPQILLVLSVYLRVYRIDEVLLVYHYVMEIHTPVQLREVVISSPTIGNDVGARQTPLLDQWLQCLCCSVGHNFFFFRVPPSFNMLKIQAGEQEKSEIYIYIYIYIYI